MKELKNRYVAAMMGQVKGTGSTPAPRHTKGRC